MQSTTETVETKLIQNALKEEKVWTDPLPEVAKRFKLAMGNLVPIQIEQLSGVSRTIVSRCINGEQAPNYPLLAYYRKAKGISTDWILYGIKNPVEFQHIVTNEKPTADRLAFLIDLAAQNLSKDDRIQLAIRLLKD
jgi:hypothetical protein